MRLLWYTHTDAYTRQAEAAAGVPLRSWPVEVYKWLRIPMGFVIRSEDITPFSRQAAPRGEGHPDRRAGASRHQALRHRRQRARAPGGGGWAVAVLLVEPLHHLNASRILLGGLAEPQR